MITAPILDTVRHRRTRLSAIGLALATVVLSGACAGPVGGTEAINVISAYYRDAPTMAEGTGRHLAVQGWRCSADTGAYGSGSIGCGKDGFAFHTRP